MNKYSSILPFVLHNKTIVYGDKIRDLVQFFSPHESHLTLGDLILIKIPSWVLSLKTLLITMKYFKM